MVEERSPQIIMTKYLLKYTVILAEKKLKAYQCDSSPIYDSSCKPQSAYFFAMYLYEKIIVRL